MLASENASESLSSEREKPVQIRRHPVYWFEDGSLILAVQGYAFKLHKTLLSRHSKYLHTALNINGDKISNKNLPDALDFGSDGCNYVELGRQVTVSDTEALLKHIYHDIPLDDTTPFSHVISVLRISSPLRLDFPNIHKLARRSFESLFPVDPSPNLLPPDEWHEALLLATELDIHSVRKVILYTIVTTMEFENEDLQEEVPIAISNGNATPNPTTSNNILANHVLSKSDQALCKRLMTHLIDHFTAILFTPPSTPHMACTDVFADTWMTLVIQPAIANDGVYKPLETLEKIKSVRWEDMNLCSSCVVGKHEEWTQEQQSIWTLIDSWIT